MEEEVEIEIAFLEQVVPENLEPKTAKIKYFSDYEKYNLCVYFFFLHKLCPTFSFPENFRS